MNRDDGLTWEQGRARDLARRFADEYLRPAAAETERRRGRFPRHLLGVMRQYGLVGLDVPVRYGGAGLDAFTTSLVLEQLARGWFAATTYAVQLVTGVILAAGSDEQRSEYLPRIATGSLITAFALTEEESGSDAWAMRTRVVRSGDEYIIRGKKTLITNADLADVIAVFAKSDPTAARPGGVSILLVHRDDPGLRPGQTFTTLAHNANPVGEVVLDECRVPVTRCLGTPGDGFRYIQSGFARSRVFHAVRAVGLAQAALDYAAEYARTRRQFGRPIASFQGMRFKFGDMITLLEAARQLTYAAARSVDTNSRDAMRLASMAKLFASDAAMRISCEAVQVLGGHGYTTEHPVERYFREAKLLQIGEGTNEIQRLVISRTALSAETQRTR